MPEDIEGALQFAQNAPCNNLEIVCGENILDQDGKFIAAQARCRVLGAQRSKESSGGRHEKSVARGVAEAIVDFLEFVQIQIENAATVVGAAHATAQREVEAVKEERPVRQACEHVVHGVVLEFFFGLLVLADVAK